MSAEFVLVEAPASHSEAAYYVAQPWNEERQLWGMGHLLVLESFEERYGLNVPHAELLKDIFSEGLIKRTHSHQLWDAISLVNPFGLNKLIMAWAESAPDFINAKMVNTSLGASEAADIVNLATCIDWGDALLLNEYGVEGSIATNDQLDVGEYPYYVEDHFARGSSVRDFAEAESLSLFRWSYKVRWQKLGDREIRPLIECDEEGHYNAYVTFLRERELDNGYLLNEPVATYLQPFDRSKIEDEQHS